LIQYYFFWNDTSQFFLVLKVEIILTPVVAVVVVVVAVIVVVVAGIISTRVIVVAVGRGGDYLDTCCSSSRRWRLSRELSCSETVLWTTNCPLVLAYSGLGTAVTFRWSLYTFRIQSVFLLIHKICTRMIIHNLTSSASPG
jgi:hypothetical protein